MGVGGWVFYFFTSQAWNSHDNTVAPRNAPLTHLGVNSCKMHALGRSTLRLQKTSHSDSKQGLFSGSDFLGQTEPPGTTCPHFLGSLRWLLCGEEFRPVVTPSLPPALVLISCSGLGSELLDSVPSLALRR